MRNLSLGTLAEGVVWLVRSLALFEVAVHFSLAALATLPLMSSGASAITMEIPPT